MAKHHFSQLTVALTAVVVSSVIAAAGLTLADHDAACGGTTAMPTGAPSGQWYECNTATAQWELKTMTTGGGSCPGSPPTSTSWCDMATFTWKESGSTTGCPGSQPGAGYWCSGSIWMPSSGGGGSCPGSPPTSTSWCDMATFTWKESASSGGCGTEPPWPDCAEKSCSNGTWTCTRMNTASGGGCPAPAFTDKPSCVAYCTGKGMGDCNWACDDFNPCGPGTTGTTGGGSDCYSRCIAEPQSPAICTTSCYPGTGTSSDCDRCMSEGGTRISCENSGRCPKSGMGGATSYAECVAQECASMPAPAAYQACKDSCQSRFSGVGGGGGVEWCFYSATKDGSDLGYSIACPKGSTGDCHKYTRQGEQVPSAGLTLKSSSSCWLEGGGGNWPTTGNTPCSACANMPEGAAKSQCYSTPPCGGGGGDGGSSSMRRCIYHNASWKERNQLNKAPGLIGKDVHCKADYEGCDVLSTAAGTQKSLPVDTPQGYGIPAPRMDVSLGAPFCCEEGWSNKCEGSSMNCRDKEAYWACIGGRNAPMDSARSRSCEEKHCWFRDGDTGQKECKDPMPKTKKGEYGWWQCVGRIWEWMHGDPPPPPPPPPPVEFCKKFPEHEKCKVPPPPVPGTCEEKIAALQQKISTLDEQVENLKLELVDAKDAVTEKNDDIRALKKEKAPRAEINAAKKELKILKRAVSKIVSQGKKLSRELRFAEDQYGRLQRTCYPPIY